MCIYVESPIGLPQFKNAYREVLPVVCMKTQYLLEDPSIEGKKHPTWDMKFLSTFPTNNQTLKAVWE